MAGLPAAPFRPFRGASGRAAAPEAKARGGIRSADDAAAMEFIDHLPGE